MTTLPAAHPPLRAVLFDRDDTIAYTDREIYAEAASWAARTYGLDAQAVGTAMLGQWQEQALAWWDLRTEDDETSFWDGYGLDLMERLGLPHAEAVAFMAEYPYERFMKPVPHAREVLQQLRARGLKIGVLSNTLPSIARTLEAVGLDDLVDVAVATCSVGVHKPDAGAFLHAADALGVLPEEILFVDDRLENVEAARALGMRAELIDLQGWEMQAIHDLRAVLELVDEVVAGAC
ncbi:HAD family hydrolase [Deinococcus humi]|uniref:Putative hydrolase of the HAD superfamily n=1 Tax=Deinococcus humi TaxID=662880 RepID=A0A7W8JVI0_9DEIO|nr:HAD family phosphatase [Deinococcus humi]MBB5362561.1 putative hydrolase of the HAD superfamily [Deinococcus humi]GGO28203.1 hydrolase [Deinococcus humi]